MYNMKVNEIYLFGSYAYGKPTKASDFDIYVVFFIYECIVIKSKIV